LGEDIATATPATGSFFFSQSQKKEYGLQTEIETSFRNFVQENVTKREELLIKNDLKRSCESKNYEKLKSGT
jgi:hypothetical protein